MDARMAALEAVAEAALFVERCVNAGVFDAQECAYVFDGMQAALKALAALDALPPAQPAGETVEVRGCVVRHGDTYYAYGAAGETDSEVRATLEDAGYVPICMFTVHVPKEPPPLPTILATVEPTP